MIITVDGLSGTGKGTLSVKLAKHFSLPLLETGALWRKLALYVGAEGYDYASESEVLAALKAMPNVEYPAKDLRHEDTSQQASIISGYAEARAMMDQKIAVWAAKAGGAVLDGRDCGKTIVTHADFKFFLVCDAYVRAMRRSKSPSALVEMRRGITDRDVREINRKHGSSLPAPDAIVLDTTTKNAQETFKTALDLIAARGRWHQIYRDATF